MRDAMAGFGRLLAAGVLCWLTIRAAALYRYPFGGGEFHAIFAYPSGSFDAAGGVFLAYLGSATALTALLVLLGYRLAWWAVALVASAVCLDAWWQVCSFEYTIPQIQTPALRLLPVIPVALLATAALMDRLRGAVLRRRAVTAAG